MIKLDQEWITLIILWIKSKMEALIELYIDFIDRKIN